MKLSTLQLAAALLAMAGAAQAAPPDPMAGFYGNTVTIDVPAGYYSARRFIDPDGTWREPHGSDEIRGVWRIDVGQVCSWQTEPPVHNPRHYCYPVVARKVGDKWTTVDPDSGNTVYQAIEPGRR
jgi:hypothetical protein